MLLPPSKNVTGKNWDQSRHLQLIEAYHNKTMGLPSDIPFVQLVEVDPVGPVAMQDGAEGEPVLPGRRHVGDVHAL